MSNSVPIQTIVAKKVLARLQNKLPMMSNVNKDYQDDLKKSELRDGGIINVTKPPLYDVRSGEIMEVQSTVIPSLSTSLNMKGVDISASQLDLQISYDQVESGMIDGAMDGAASALAAQIESDGYALALKVANVVGTPGTALTDPSYLATAGALITSNGGLIGKRNRIGLLNSFQNASFASGVKTYFNPVNTVSDAYADGILGNGYGFDLYDEPVATTFTAGTYGGSPLVNGALVAGTSIVTDGWTGTTTTLNIGDTFTIAGVYNRNPQSKASTGALKNFVVAAVTTTDSSGNSTITIGEDGLILTGPRQNVVITAANGADNQAITVTSGASGTISKQSLLYDKNAFTFAMVPLAPVPTNLGVMSTVVKDKMSGLSISLKEFYDGRTNQRMVRFDVLYAWLETYPQLAVRVLG
ncbi:MAG: P22 phage major capsid protein family protein [Pseudomonadota bacterium]